MKYKVIIRDSAEGSEQYVKDLSKADAVMEAAKQAADKQKQVYVEWTDAKGGSGYLNRDGAADNGCPGEPW